MKSVTGNRGGLETPLILADRSACAWHAAKSAASDSGVRNVGGDLGSPLSVYTRLHSHGIKCTSNRLVLDVQEASQQLESR